MKSIKNILKNKLNGKTLTALTAYDVFTASMVKNAHPDFVLVGDSLNMVFAGERSTLSATLDQMIYHSSIVSKVVKDTDIPVIGDMPFLTYHINDEDALKNAAKFFIEAELDGVKIEGARISTISNIVNNGIPVMGHIGLKPQSVHAEGGYKVYGKTDEETIQLIQDAKDLEMAGVFSIVIEGVKEEVAAQITESVSIPTIGIGAGKGADGQILVINDILGMNDETAPKFVRQYANFNELGTNALKSWIKDVNNGSFPSEEEMY